MKLHQLISIAGCALMVGQLAAGEIKLLGLDDSEGSVEFVAFQDVDDIQSLFGNPFSEATPDVDLANPPGAFPPIPQATPEPSVPLPPSPEPTPLPRDLTPAAMSDPAPATAPVGISASEPAEASAPFSESDISDPVGTSTLALATAVECQSCGDVCGGSCEASCCTTCGKSHGCLFGGCDCCLGDAFTISGLLHGDCPPAVTVGGWVSMGYHSEGNDLFNSRPEEFGLHQAWLYAEKVADSSSPFGFRADVMYGLDAGDTQAFGNPNGSWDFDNGFDHDDYGWAIPQLYAEVALGAWSIKAGHFYTLIGYEVVTAPDNFFYSHAMTMYNSEPFTHTGVLATREVGDSLTVYAGWTLGWDTGFDQLDGGSSWLGGAGYSLSDDVSITYISTLGNFGWRGDDAYSHSIVVDMSMTDNLNWIVQSDMVRVDSTGEDNVGLNQYLLYTASDCLAFGTRLEWWKGDVLTGFAPHGGVLPAAGSLSYYAATFGANVRPHANLMIRPEVRIDWSPAADYDETYFGIDAIVTF